MSKDSIVKPGWETHKVTRENVSSLKVFYDGSCPICRREIAFYGSREGSNNIDWINVHTNSRELEIASVSKSDALARLHVITSDGNVATGVDAFQKIWHTLPNFRFLANFFSFPATRWLLCKFYRYFLHHRAGLQKLASHWMDTSNLNANTGTAPVGFLKKRPKTKNF